MLTANVIQYTVTVFSVGGGFLISTYAHYQTILIVFEELSANLVTCCSSVVISQFCHIKKKISNTTVNTTLFCIHQISLIQLFWILHYFYSLWVHKIVGFLFIYFPDYTFQFWIWHSILSPPVIFSSQGKISLQSYFCYQSINMHCMSKRHLLKQLLVGVNSS